MTDRVALLAVLYLAELNYSNFLPKWGQKGINPRMGRRPCFWNPPQNQQLRDFRELQMSTDLTYSGQWGVVDSPCSSFHPLRRQRCWSSCRSHLLADASTHIWPSVTNKRENQSLVSNHTRQQNFKKKKRIGGAEIDIEWKTTCNRTGPADKTWCVEDPSAIMICWFAESCYRFSV